MPSVATLRRALPAVLVPARGLDFRCGGYPRFRRERFSACRFGSLEAVPPALEAHDFLVILDGAGQTQQAQFMTTLLQRHELLPSLGVKMGRASFPGSDHVVERLKGCIDFGNGPLHACALSEVQRPSDTAFR